MTPLTTRRAKLATQLISYFTPDPNYPIDLMENEYRLNAEERDLLREALNLWIEVEA